MTDHHEARIRLRRCFRSREAPAERQRRRDDVEEIGGDQERHERRRHIAVAEVDALLELIAGHAGERAAVIEHSPTGIWHVAAVAGADDDELLGTGRRRRRKQQAVGEGEDRQVRADPERNRQRGRGE